MKNKCLFLEQYKWFEIKEGELGCMDGFVVQHLVVTAETYVHDPGNRGDV